MKVTQLGVFAMLGVLVISALMVPVTMEFADEIQSTESNDEANTYNLSSTNRPVTLEIKNGFGYINDERIGENFRFNMIMFTDSFIVVYPAANAGSIDAFYMYTATATESVVKIDLNNGVWTATNKTNEVTTGTYSWVMRYSENGDYYRMGNNSVAYVDSAADIYIVNNTSDVTGLWTGTVTNFSKVFANTTEVTNPTLTYETYTTTPEVYEVSAITNGTLFIPTKYHVITSTDNMTKTIVGLSPLFVGIALFAFMGMNLVRTNKP